METREWRMYGLTPYNISPIQTGIQFGHAVVEYANDHYSDPEYQQWARKDKTFIILNGGTTNLNIETPGSLNKHAVTLEEAGVKIARFHEPDLGDQLTAVVFLVDDRVWDRKKFPDYSGPMIGNFRETTPMQPHYDMWKEGFGISDPAELEKILFLREFLSPKNFKFA